MGEGVLREVVGEIGRKKNPQISFFVVVLLLL